MSDEELRKLCDAATPMDERVTIMRYEHGGGRVYRESRFKPGRKLIADFFRESDRECWIAAREAIPRLLAEKERLLNALAWIIEATNENHIEDRATSAIRAVLDQGGQDNDGG